MLQSQSLAGRLPPKHMFSTLFLLQSHPALLRTEPSFHRALFSIKIHSALNTIQPAVCLCGEWVASIFISFYLSGGRIRCTRSPGKPSGWTMGLARFPFLAALDLPLWSVALAGRLTCTHLRGFQETVLLGCGGSVYVGFEVGPTGN